MSRFIQLNLTDLTFKGILMAIYKNRLVHVVGPNNQANSPETINVKYKDGTHENVKLSDVSFTDDEQKSLQKSYPSKYDSVNKATQEDVDAVNTGIAPPSDPSLKQQVKDSSFHDKQVKAAADQKKKLEDEASKEDKKTVTPPAQSPVVTVPSSTSTPVTSTPASTTVSPGSVNTPNTSV